MVKELEQKKKDLWEKISALTPLILGILVTGVGVFFTQVYNFRQLQLNQIAALDKLRPLLISNLPEDREFAYSSFAALGYEDIAIKIIQIKKDQSGRPVLEQLYQAGNPQIRAEAGNAIKTLDEAQKLVNKLEFGDSRGLDAYYERTKKIYDDYRQRTKKIYDDLGIKTQLGQAVILDTLISNGPEQVDYLIKITTQDIGSNPKGGANEKQWIKKFNLLRKKVRYLAGWQPIYGGPFESRVSELNKLIEQDDWTLKTLEKEQLK